MNEQFIFLVKRSFTFVGIYVDKHVYDPKARNFRDKVFHYCETHGETVLNCVFYNVQINQKSYMEKRHFHKCFQSSVLAN